MSTASNDSLLGDVDAVEIKVTLDADQIEDALVAFGFRSQTAHERQVWFCEYIVESGGSAALPLLARGLILRIRSTDGDGDSTVKLRGPEGCVDPKAWRRRTREAGRKTKIEGDWAGTRRLVSASLDADIDGQRLARVLRTQDRRLSPLFSRLQEDLLHEWLVPVDQLVILGPVMAQKWDSEDRGLDHRIAAETWQVDERLRFLELSIRVEPPDADVAKRALEALVRDRGLELPDQQQTKTQLVLQHLAAKLRR